MTVSFVRLRFLIIFKISYVENSTDESDLHVFLVKTERSFLLLLTREKCFEISKEVIKEFSLFLRVHDEFVIVQQKWNTGYLFII